MRTFRYRAPRFSADFPIRLTIGESSHLARCKEISTFGMKLEIGRPLVCGSRGTLQLSFEQFSFSLPFLVTNSQAEIGGISFIYESDQQRSDVNQLLAWLRTEKSCTSLAVNRQIP